MNVRLAFVISLVAAISASAQSNLEPAGKIHIPIGKPNTVDALKTFVEAEGNYSPGVGSYGVYFWVWDEATRKLWAPTMLETACEHGLDEGSLLLPWTKWRAGDVQVNTLVGQSSLPTGQGDLQMVAARVTLKNTTTKKQSLSLYAAVRPIGAAGGPIHAISVSNRDMILVDGQPALVCGQPADNVGVLAEDQIGQAALQEQMPVGQASGWFAFDEGGLSGIGNWNRLRSRLEIKPFFGTTLGTMAMPHGWAIAEFHLLLRDCLAYEDNQQLVLFAGIPENWFDRPMIVHGLPTHFGRFNMDYSPGTKSLRVTIEEPPADGILVRFPAPFTKKITVDGVECRPASDGSVRLDPRKQIELRF